MSIALRQAELSDIPFLVEAIVAAETSGDTGEPTTYEKMFSLSRSEFEDLITTILTKDGEGHQLARESFFILERDGAPIATCAAWIEPKEGGASGFQVASLLAAALGMKRWVSAKNQIRAMSKVTPERSRGALQMETFFVTPGFRGERLTARLIEAVRDHFVQNGAEFIAVEILLLDTNTRALTAYQRAGFATYVESRSVDPLFKELTRSDGFVQVRAAGSP